MDEEDFKIKLELDTNQFYKDLDKVESVTKNLDKNPHKISLFVDKKDFDNQAKEAFNTFDKMALKSSKVTAARSLFGNKNEYYAYARIFNDIRSNAMDALRNISNEGRKLQLKVETNNVDDAKEKLKEMENQLKLLQSKSENYSWLDMNKDQITDALNQAIQERKVLSGKRLTPARLGEDDVAKQYTEQINSLTTRINQMRDKLFGGKGVSKEELDSYAKLKQEIAQIVVLIAQLKSQIATGSVVNAEDTAKLQQLRSSYDAILEDLKKNPLQVKLTSEELSKQNNHTKEILSHYRGINKEAKKMTMFSRITSSMFTRMRFQVVSWLNPFNRAKDIWQEFTAQQKAVGNTFQMIGKNFVRVITPMLMKLSQLLVNIAGYADKFLIGLQKAFGVKEPISLFDVDGLIEAERRLKSMNSMTAGFDELHGQNDLTDLEKWGTLTPTLEPGWESNFEQWGEKAGEIFSFAMEHPLLAALTAIFGTSLLKLLGSTVLKGLGSLGSKLFKGIFGGSAAKTAATSSGSLLGGLFGKALYTGAGGKIVTVGKLLGGITLVAGGAAGAITTAVKAGSNWEDLSTGAKIGTQALQGVFSAATGLGAVLLGASGPVGWGIALGTFAVSAAIGMAQVQDGIGSVKEETEKLAVTQQVAAEANNAYLQATNDLSQTMSNLEQLEQQTKLSGAELAKQVKNGTLSVENMTSAQLQVYNAYLQNQQAIENLRLATELKTEADKQNILQSLQTEAANAIAADSYDNLRDKVVQAWQEGSISAQEAGDILSRTLANADEETQRVFGKNIPEDIRAAFNPDKYESTWRTFGKSFKTIMGNIGNWFSDTWTNLKSWWTNLWNKNTTTTSVLPKR